MTDFSRFSSSKVLLFSFVCAHLMYCGYSKVCLLSDKEISNSTCNSLLLSQNCKEYDNSFCNDEGHCECLDNYEPSEDKSYCQKYPDIVGQYCRECCDTGRYKNLRCVQHKCQMCQENANGDLTCVVNALQNQHLLLTVTQIAMTGAMMLGIITILTLFWKLCSKTTYRRERVGETNFHGRPTTSSVNSIQREVSERLQDAPPPYRSRLPPPSDNPPAYNSLTGSAAAAYVNNVFVEDELPPDYDSIANPSANSEDKDNSNEQTIHI